VYHPKRDLRGQVKPGVPPNSRHKGQKMGTPQSPTSWGNGDHVKKTYQKSPKPKRVLFENQTFNTTLGNQREEFQPSEKKIIQNSFSVGPFPTYVHEVANGVRSIPIAQGRGIQKNVGSRATARLFTNVRKIRNTTTAKQLFRGKLSRPFGKSIKGRQKTLLFKKVRDHGRCPLEGGKK